MAQILDDADSDALISRLSRPLTVADREAFRTAARAALANLEVHGLRGAGSDYRALKDVQRRFFDPPPDRVASWRIEHEFGPSKLRDAPAIEHDGDGRRVRHRKQHAR